MRVKEALDCAAEPVSLSEPLGDEGAELGDTIVDDVALSPQDQAVRLVELQEMARAIAALEDPEYHVLRLRFGLGDEEPATLAETGRRLQLAGDTARTVHLRTLTKLRRSMEGSRTLVASVFGDADRTDTT
jgi:RNA polymerase primary sigma factor